MHALYFYIEVPALFRSMYIALHMFLKCKQVKEEYNEIVIRTYCTHTAVLLLCVYVKQFQLVKSSGYTIYTYYKLVTDKRGKVLAQLILTQR